MTNTHTSLQSLTVLGGSRGTGALVAARARAAGHDVRVVSRYGGPDPRCIAADAADPDRVRELIRGSDAVAVLVGAPGRDSSGVRTAVTRAAIAAMRTEGVRRLIVQSSFGVAETAELLPFFTRRIVVPYFLRNAFDDHERQEALVRDSHVDWTIVRPGYLTDRPSSAGRIEIAAGEPMSAKVSRHDVARRIVDLLGEPDSIGRAITLGTPR